ncbi:MAG: hypothetical protein V4494_06230 [Chlamydiota bacterium]
MFCYVMIVAFIGNFAPPAKEECIQELNAYLKQGFSLEEVKNHLSDQFQSSEERVAFEKFYQLLETSTPSGIYPVTDDSLDLFYSLGLSSEDERIIHKIISTMAEKNIFSLLFERRDLEKKGKQLDHLHPFRFLGVIFSNHHLRSSMREVKKSTFKWDGFMDGFSARMKEESIRGNLIRYIPGFAEYVGVDPDKVEHYILHHNWEGLVRYLLQSH